jgi:uncharacterized protein (TIGR04255 family)
MGTKMGNAPIILILGQIRFNPVQQMASFVDGIQEQFRKLRFAGFVQDELKGLHVDTRSATPQVDIRSESRWRFTDSHKTSEFLLSRNSLTFQTTAYETKEMFLDGFLKGIDVIHRAAQLEYVEGIGIRTIDAVVPVKGENLRDYLKPQLLGFYESDLGDVKHSILEGVFSFAVNSLLVSRVAILKGALGLPLDLMPIVLSIKPKFTDTNGDHAILDNDRSEQIQFDFDIEEIRKKFFMLKVDVSKAFYNAVTEGALQRWK